MRILRMPWERSPFQGVLQKISHLISERQTFAIILRFQHYIADLSSVSAMVKDSQVDTGKKI